MVRLKLEFLLLTSLQQLVIEREWHVLKLLVDQIVWLVMAGGFI